MFIMTDLGKKCIQKTTLWLVLLRENDMYAFFLKFKSMILN